MAATVFHLDPPGDDGFVVGDVLELDGPEGRHAATVRRFGVGERFIVTDGAGAYARVTVTAAATGRLTVRVDEAGTDPAPNPAVTVVQAIPKSDRAEQTVDALTEAGADRIVPWQADRCVSRWRSGTSDKSAKAITRWRAVAREAAKQARRLRFPEVGDLAGTAETAAQVAATVAAGGTAWVLHESATEPLPQLLAGGDLGAAVLLVVGPEGGITDDELARLTAAGARAVRLGPQVLRTVLAGALALAAIGAGTDRWTPAPPEIDG